MSSSRRLAVLGATGQLGRDVLREAAAAGIDAVALGHEQVEVTDAVSVRAVLSRSDVGAVINCAAFHQVDRCEEDPATAFQVNALGAYHVATAAAELGLRIVHISTDYVFSGERPAPVDGRPDAATGWSEDDLPRPLNVYGVSKLAGEHAVLASGADALVARVASLFGVAGARGKGGNFIEAILKKAREGGPLKVVADQWMTPTYTRDAARALVALVFGEARGIVHVTNAGACTWHALASEAVRQAGLSVAVEPVPASTWPSKVRRPANSALRTDRLAGVLTAPLRSWQDAVGAYIEEKGHRSRA